MKLNQVFKPVDPNERVKINIDGIDDDLHVRVLSNGEVTAILSDVSSSSGFDFASLLIEKCLVDAEGKPILTIPEIRKASTDSLDVFNKIVKHIKEINNMIDKKASKKLGEK